MSELENAGAKMMKSLRIMLSTTAALEKASGEYRQLEEDCRYTRESYYKAVEAYSAAFTREATSK